MKNNFLKPLGILLLLALTTFACSSKYAGFDKTANGLYYKIIKESKDTLKPRLGDWVSLNMSWQYKDSVMFDSRKAQGGMPIRFQVPASDFKGDLYEGIKLMSAGDSAVFLINSDSLFRKTFRQPSRPKFVDTNSVVTFHVKLISIDNPQSLIKKEQDELVKYLTDKKITVQPAESGLYFIETVAGKGLAIDTGMWVSVHFKVLLIDGKQLFSSYDRGEPITFEYGKRFDTPGVEQAIGMMKKGGKAMAIVPSKIAFGETGRGSVVPPFATMIYELEIVNVQTKAEHDKAAAEEKKKAQEKLMKNKIEEAASLGKYLKEKNITAKPTASGIYYIERVKGTGTKAAAGKVVKVHYTGTLLNGTKFDSSRDKNQPYEFTLGQGQVIKGWDEGIELMNVGGKATLIIPSNMAYGERDKGTIPPYSTLVFEVELMDVKDAKPAAPAK
ncbi:MAG: FKBP-type peptidyl-prolyl cis-trans isomerase [Bacteroidales bacterium]